MVFRQAFREYEGNVNAFHRVFEVFRGVKGIQRRTKEVSASLRGFSGSLGNFRSISGLPGRFYERFEVFKELPELI